MMMQIGVIPARYQSVRFPGKPLVKILGVPMVVRTWQQACLCKTLSKVIVATDDERIAEACRQEGAEVVMTSVSCANGALGYVCTLCMPCRRCPLHAAAVQQCASALCMPCRSAGCELHVNISSESSGHFCLLDVLRSVDD